MRVFTLTFIFLWFSLPFYSCIREKKAIDYSLNTEYDIVLDSCLNYACDYLNDWQLKCLKGKPKKITSLRYHLEKDEIVTRFRDPYELFLFNGDTLYRKEWQHEIFTFNRNGYRVDQIHLNKNGDIESKNTLVYDSNNNIIEQNSPVCDFGKYESERRISKYDSQNREVYRADYGNGKLVRKTTIVYFDEYGSNTKISYNGEEEITHKRIFRHDDHDTIAEEWVRSSNDEMILREVTYKDPNNEEEYISKYMNDEGNLLVKKKSRSPEIIDELGSYHPYNEEYIRLLLKREHCGLNIDQNNCKVKLEDYYEYKYDNVGNVVQEVGYEDGVPAELLIRSIVYY